MRMLLLLVLFLSSVVVRADVLAPTITHAPPARVEQGEQLEVIAEVEDNYAVATVDLYISKDGGSFRKIEMTYTHGSTYRWAMTDSAVQGVRYYIEAMDTAGNVVASGSASMPYALDFIAATTTVPPAQEVPSSPHAESTVETMASIEPPEPPKKKSWLKWVGIIGAAVLVGAVASAGGGGGGGGDPGPVAANEPQPDPGPQPQPEQRRGGIFIGGEGLR